MTSIKYVFDVDGTLTPSRGKIDPEFEKFFYDFCKLNDVYLVTGSDKDKTVEQIGDVLFGMAKVVYNCSGNDVWSAGVNVRTNNWTLPTELRNDLESWLQDSSFVLRTGNHIEERPGCVNFSIVGRNCTLGERKLYIKHDLTNKERETIATQISSKFPSITATVGGETGIDIYPTGFDKGQVYYEFNEHDYIVFFGDRTEPSGNDYPLAIKIQPEKGEVHQVNGWKNTWELLKLKRLTTQ